ncbi:putative bifunctional diguanylate cyclase/phosphodiesterase [Modestobacter lapidis]|nr:EAL domain-containing protein [Modestobacter lapidis]
MSVPARLRPLPGAPRWALVLVAVLATAEVVAATVPALRPREDALGLTLGHLGLVLALHVCLCVVLLWRARSVAHERFLWHRLALAAVLTAVCFAVATLMYLSPATSWLGFLPVAWAPLLAFPLVYGGLVRWNRYSTNLADPNDVLNGLSAVLAVVAVMALAMAHAGAGLADLPWWQLQPLLLQCAAGFVIAGTAASVPFIGGMGRDPRSWLLAVAFTAQLAAGAVKLTDPAHPVGWVGAAQAVGVVAMCLAATLRPTPATPQPTDPTASTIGAFVVIVASTVVLVGSAVATSSPTAVWCAALAATGASLRLLFNVRDLAQLAVSRREALTDELTGLANRRAVLRRLEESCTDGVPLVLALLDLDKFKEVNDGLGHAAGDDLLRLVARRLEDALSPGDLVGRLGGDEFAVVAGVGAGGTSEGRAAELRQRLTTWLAEPFEVGGLQLHTGVSIGMTSRDRAGITEAPPAPAQLLREADAAMYDAKRSGTGVAVYDSTRHTDSSGRLALVEELRTALATGQLVLHHQPQVDVGTGRTLGVEALVRWEHPVRGLLGPVDFLPLAEVHGLMGAVTEEVLTQAVAQAAAWRRSGLALRVSVNLSASNLLDTGLPQRVAELLRRHDVPPSVLVLEVTESVLLSDPERSLAVVAALHELGTTVSIDDFGTGWSSLTYLRELPLGELKLDRSFTADLLTDPRTAAIVASTIALAHDLGLRVVAEGVEQEATLARLQLLGCDESQGYLHSRPLPAAELCDWLLRHSARREVPVLR